MSVTELSYDEKRVQLVQEFQVFDASGLLQCSLTAVQLAVSDSKMQENAR